MARYTGPVAKIWRRIGQIPPDGSTPAVQRRTYPPGQHGLKRQSKLSEYGQQLREKQKAKYTYGVLERQFANYYKEADRQSGVTGENLMKLLEMRLDNVVFRLGIVPTRRQARQMVNHGHVLVNGSKLSIPSAQVRVGDTLEFSKKYRIMLENTIDAETFKNATQPAWLSFEPKKLSGTVVSEPQRLDIDGTINEQLIVEYYSR